MYNFCNLHVMWFFLPERKTCLRLTAMKNEVNERVWLACCNYLTLNNNCGILKATFLDFTHLWKLFALFIFSFVQRREQRTKDELTKERQSAALQKGMIKQQNGSDKPKQTEGLALANAMLTFTIATRHRQHSNSYFTGTILVFFLIPFCNKTWLTAPSLSLKYPWAPAASGHEAKRPPASSQLCPFTTICFPLSRSAKK